MKYLQRLGGLLTGFGLTAAALAWSPLAAAAEPVKTLRLYALDCGHIDVQDMAVFADTGEYDGKPGKLVAPCFVIRHPKGTLMWDTGLGDSFVEHVGGVDNGGFHLTVDKLLKDQLALIGMTAADVNYVAFSHFHFDHTGNANQFAAATWLLNKAELAWAEQTPTPFGVVPASFSAYKTAQVKDVEGDYDVFGDGSVRILKAPGHTAGHQVLMLKLPKSGTVILSGDLYHTRENRQAKRVPAFNDNRANTLASIDRIERIVKNTHARFVIQHDSADFAALPKPPAALE